MSDELLRNETLKVMIVVTEKYQEKVTALIPEAWKYIVTHSIEECTAKLDTLCRFVLIHDYVIKDNPNKLEKLVIPNPATRILLYLDYMKLQDSIQLFNDNKIHRLIGLPNGDFIEIMQSAIREFNKLSRELRNEQLLYDRQNYRETNVLPQDQLLELSLQLSDALEIKDFTNQFVSMIDGIQSFITVNYTVYRQSLDPVAQQTMIGYLSDLELLANQYDQRILMMYVETIRSYFYLLLDEIETAMNHYQSCIRIFYWISSEYLDPKLIEIINSYPIFEDDLHYIQQGEKEFILDAQLEQEIHNKLEMLLNFDIPKLTNISEILYKNLKVDSNVVAAILVVRDSLPLFVFKNSDDEVEPALIGAFVDALSTFLKEVVDSEGDIDHIQHDKGVILLHKEKNIRYLLVSSQDEVYLRIGLRQFAQETVETFQNVPENRKVTDEDYIMMKWKIEKLFKLN